MDNVYLCDVGTWRTCNSGAKCDTYSGNYCNGASWQTGDGTTFVCGYSGTYSCQGCDYGRLRYKCNGAAGAAGDCSTSEWDGSASDVGQCGTVVCQTGTLTCNDINHMCQYGRLNKKCSDGACSLEYWEVVAGSGCQSQPCPNGACDASGNCILSDKDNDETACTTSGGIWTASLTSPHTCCGDDTGNWIDGIYFCDETNKIRKECDSTTKCNTVISGGTTYYCNGAIWTSGNGCGFLCATGVCNGAGSCVADPCAGKNTGCYTERTCSSGSVSCTYKASGSSCDDGAFCSINDQCDSNGNCVGGSTRTCPVCKACDETADACVNSGTGTPCNDGLFCTINDHCDGSGGCIGGGAKDCADADTCTVDTCNEISDQCSHDAGGKTLKEKYSDSNNKGCCLSNQCWDGAACVALGQTAGTNQEWLCTGAATNGGWESCTSTTACQSKVIGSTTYYCGYPSVTYQWSNTNPEGQVCNTDGSKCTTGSCQLVDTCIACTSSCGAGLSCIGNKCVPTIPSPTACGCSAPNIPIVCPNVPTTGKIADGRDVSCLIDRSCLSGYVCGFSNKTSGSTCENKNCPTQCTMIGSYLLTYSPCTKTCDASGHCQDCSCTVSANTTATKSQYCASATTTSFSNCPTGQGNCDLNSTNQCETPLNTIQNCGSCGNICNGGAGSACCSGACTDTKMDPNNCGGCGRSCGTGKACANGACCTSVGNTCSLDADCCMGYRCISGTCRAGACESNSLGCDTGGKTGKCGDNYLAGAAGEGLVCCDKSKGDKLVIKNERYRCLSNYTEDWLGLDCYNDWGINTLGVKGKVRAGPNLGEYGCCTGNGCWSGTGCVAEGTTASAGGIVRAVCRAGIWVYCGVQINATRTIEAACHSITVGDSTWKCGDGWVTQEVKRCGDGLCHQGECWYCAKTDRQVQVGSQFEGMMCTPSGFRDTVCMSDIDCADTNDCTTDKCDLVNQDADGFGCVHIKKSCGTECEIGTEKGVCDSERCIVRGQVGESCTCETCAQGLKCSGGICTVQSSCSNGVCDEGECSTCTKDCSLEKCAGNGVCDTAVGENCANTAADCGCGGRKCDIQEKSADIRGCVTSACGDGICLPGECGFCTADCKPENCINQVCDAAIGEKCSNSVDCTCRVEISVQDIKELPEGSRTVVPIRVKNTGNSRVKYKINLESDLNLNWKSTELELNPGEEKLEQVEVWTDKSQERGLLTKSFDYKSLKVSAVIEETGQEVKKQTANISVSKQPLWIDIFNTISTALNWWQFLGAIVGLVFGIRYLAYRFKSRNLVVPHDEKPGGYFNNRYQTAHPATYGQPQPVKKTENVEEAERKFVGQFG